MTERHNHKAWLLLGGCALVICAVFAFIGPIEQDPLYHHFSDTRRWLGIENFGDVASNALFIPAGLYGLWVLRTRAPDPTRLPLAVFFIGVSLIAPGSAYYHWNPTNATLFWDRLPMSAAFMALTAAIITDRINAKIGVRVILPLLIAVGAASVLYWARTEAAGAGDLRAYGLVQYFPMVVIPFVLWLFPKDGVIGWKALGGLFVFYALAKGLDYFDHQVLALLGDVVSGHTLKHSFAALAPVSFVMNLRRSSVVVHGMQGEAFSPPEPSLAQVLTPIKAPQTAIKG